MSLLEGSIREHLNKIATRTMAVLDPIKVVIENYPEGEWEMRQARNNPEDESAGLREIPFGREIYIDRDDFMEDPPKKFFRLGPGREVCLKYSYFLKCHDYVKDPETGKVTELRCTYDPEAFGGKAPDGRKVKGYIHWVSAKHAIDAEVRLYEPLFSLEDMGNVPEDKDWKDFINPESLKVLTGCKLEPGMAGVTSAERFQFERKGYFCLDPQNSTSERLVFNRTVSLKDAFRKSKKK